MRWIVLLSLLIGSLQVYGQSSKTETVIIKTAISCDHCKQCESCGKNIYDGIYKEAGIKKIKIDPDAHTVTVTYNSSKTSPEKIRLAISKTGFDADDIKADPEAYAKLDGCCKSDGE